MSGSAFPALLQLACSINMLGVPGQSSQVGSGVNLDQIRVLPGPCSRYLPAQMKQLSGFRSKSWGGSFCILQKCLGIPVRWVSVLADGG